MKIKIGDKVRFLNDTGSGMVVKLLKGNMVEIRTLDGWDIPYRTQDLIVIPADDGEAYIPEPTVEIVNKEPKKQQEGIKPSTRSVDNEVFVLIAQQPGQDQFAGISLYLVNETGSSLYFAYYQNYGQSAVLQLNEILEPGTKILLDELVLENLSETKGWHIQGIFFSDHMDSVRDPIDQFIPFNVKKFSSRGAYVENDYLHEPAMIVPLIQDDASKLEEAVESADLNLVIEHKEKANRVLNQSKKFKTGKIDRPPKEIDLHINQLVDNVVGLSNREILNIQMDKFHKELNDAIKTNASSIILIHGIGNGTLKTELRKSVDREYTMCTHEDASFKEYGFGATLVRIRQNK